MLYTLTLTETGLVKHPANDCIWLVSNFPNSQTSACGNDEQRWSDLAALARSLSSASSAGPSYRTRPLSEAAGVGERGASASPAVQTSLAFTLHSSLHRYKHPITSDFRKIASNQPCKRLSRTVLRKKDFRTDESDLSMFLLLNNGQQVSF